ncbi:MAG: Gfo/Idh/MocA family oxidoreductase [Planctomycetes bacterium]|nr:Gfo/Idh/MocA family oxidoreductase [Planctomycetota bacterium]
MKSNRREFLKRSAAAGAIVSVPFSWATGRARADVNSELTMAAIGVGGSRGAFSQGGYVAKRAAQHARMLAVCDVDSVHMAEFNNGFQNKLKQYIDYRELLEREKPDLVTIGTPDHWHVPIATAAMHAGCDVYCEKPLTLTIEEGFQVRDAVNETGRVFQVGTQQRSEHGLLFLKAIAIARSGRLGKKVNAIAAIGGSPPEGPFPNSNPPEGLDWDMWVGPAQKADYSLERRKEFRWYYDYSGGKMTDWGAHHIDIAQWALGLDHTGPIKISGSGKFGNVVPEKFDWVEYFEGRTSLPNGFQTPVSFSIDCEFANGAVLNVCDYYKRQQGNIEFPNGILFEGEDGRIFVNRERLTGKPVEEMNDADKKKLDEEVVKLYGSDPGDHMRNFFDCIKNRGKPIADVETHHRTMTTCHLCNIALMLGRELKWDPQKEQFNGDEQATALMSRPRREKFSWEATT